MSDQAKQSASLPIPREALTPNLSFFQDLDLVEEGKAAAADLARDPSAAQLESREGQLLARATSLVNNALLNAEPVTDSHVKHLLDVWMHEDGEVPDAKDKVTYAERALDEAQKERDMKGAIVPEPVMTSTRNIAVACGVIFGILAGPTLADFLIMVTQPEGENSILLLKVLGWLVGVAFGILVTAGPLFPVKAAPDLAGLAANATIVAGFFAALGISIFRFGDTAVDASGEPHLVFHVSAMGLFLVFFELALLFLAYFCENVMILAYKKWRERQRETEILDKQLQTASQRLAEARKQLEREQQEAAKARKDYDEAEDKNQRFRALRSEKEEYIRWVNEQLLFGFRGQLRLNKTA